MRHLIARARDERGFTMVTVMAVMFCVTLLSIAALSAAQGDLKPGAHDKSRKVAYAAAEAGVQNYLFHLSQDPNYWAKCTTGPLPHAINDPWNGVSPAADPRRWMSIPGSRSRYTIELLPATGAAACSTSSPDSTMIDAGSGTFKVRSTGQDVTTAVKRSLVVTMKRKSFLDYLYFTDKESRAPGLLSMETDGAVTREDGGGRDVSTWARQHCQRYWGNDPTVGNRGIQFYDGEVYHESTMSWGNFDTYCREGGFGVNDVLNGPVHTNDEFFIDCGSPAPKLGTAGDVVEVSMLGQLPTTPADPDVGHHGCQPPDVNFSTTSPARPTGTWKSRAAPLTLPPTNSSLKRNAAADYRFKGTTKIVMQGATMTVTGTREDGTTLSASSVAIPADGVVYVANDGSCTEYTPLDSATPTPGCGNLELEGSYGVNVTFTAENDILVTQDVSRTPSSSPFLLGLIATNYVRVNHPVTGCNPANTCNFLNGCTTPVGTPRNRSIEGAILSLTKSFIVDNWFCGGTLGDLRIYGAIAQMFRGPVNRVNLTTGASHGYEKDYRYDTRLKYRSPPYFLDPVQAQWRVQTFSEQAPAR